MTKALLGGATSSDEVLRILVLHRRGELRPQLCNTREMELDLCWCRREARRDVVTG
jgi:hypothetical protein